MRNDKVNCWEFKKCGREPDGVNTSELGVCPVSTYEKMNGVHNGVNGGRCCWVFYGACSCEAGNPKTFGEHLSICRNCDFYLILSEYEELLVVL